VVGLEKGGEVAVVVVASEEAVAGKPSEPAITTDNTGETAVVEAVAVEDKDKDKGEGEDEGGGEVKVVAKDEPNGLKSNKDGGEIDTGNDTGNEKDNDNEGLGTCRTIDEVVNAVHNLAAVEVATFADFRKNVNKQLKDEQVVWYYHHHYHHHHRHHHPLDHNHHHYHHHHSSLAPNRPQEKDKGVEEVEVPAPKKSTKKLSEGQKRKQKRKAKLKAKRDKTKKERHGVAFAELLKETLLGRQGRDTLASSDNLRLQLEVGLQAFTSD